MRYIMIYYAHLRFALMLSLADFNSLQENWTGMKTPKRRMQNTCVGSFADCGHEAQHGRFWRVKEHASRRPTMSHFHAHALLSSGPCCPTLLEPCLLRPGVVKTSRRMTNAKRSVCKTHCITIISMSLQNYYSTWYLHDSA